MSVFEFQMHSCSKKLTKIPHVLEQQGHKSILLIIWGDFCRSNQLAQLRPLWIFGE